MTGPSNRDFFKKCINAEYVREGGDNSQNYEDELHNGHHILFGTNKTVHEIDLTARNFFCVSTAATGCIA